MKKIITLFMLVMLTITVSAQKATFRHHPNQLLTGKTFMKATPKARMKANLKKKLTIKSAQPKNAATVINVNAAEIVDYGTVAEGMNEYLLAMYDSNDGYPDLEIYMYANPDDITGQYSVESGTIDNSNSYVLLSEEDFDNKNAPTNGIARIGVITLLKEAKKEAREMEQYLDISEDRIYPDFHHHNEVLKERYKNG